MAYLTPTEFAYTIRQVLDQAQVSIDEPIPDGGAHWNPGEDAWVKVTVDNTTGFPLRDVALTLDPYWGYFFPSDTTVIATWTWGGIYTVNTDIAILGDMEPNDRRWCYFRVRAGRASSIRLSTEISAEVVPYVATREGSRSVKIVDPLN